MTELGGSSSVIFLAWLGRRFAGRLALLLHLLRLRPWLLHLLRLRPRLLLHLLRLGPRLLHLLRLGPRLLHLLRLGPRLLHLLRLGPRLLHLLRLRPRLLHLLRSRLRSGRRRPFHGRRLRPLRGRREPVPGLRSGPSRSWRPAGPRGSRNRIGRRRLQNRRGLAGAPLRTPAAPWSCADGIRLCADSARRSANGARLHRAAWTPRLVTARGQRRQIISCRQGMIGRRRCAPRR